MTYRPSIAHVDESMRQRHDGSGFYVLAATVLPLDVVDDARRAARALGRGNQRFHWRDAAPAARHAAVAALAALDAAHHVVVGIGLDNPRQERGRRECMERLLWELGIAGVLEARFDARREPQNKKDIQLVDVLRIRSAIPRSLRVDHVSSRSEPLVCFADIVAGAVSAARGEGEEKYLVPLTDALVEYEIHLT